MSGGDWYPRSRDGQLHMVKTWLAVFAVKMQEWAIPQARITQLTDDLTAAENIMDIVKSGDRTASGVVECNAAFKAMEAEARFIKRHYLLIPPLSQADLPTLLLSLPDKTRTPVPPPAGQPSLTLTYPGGPHVLLVHLAALSGAGLPGTFGPHENRGDYGCALYLGIMPHGGATLEQAASAKHYLMKPPLSGDELLHHRFTRRKKEAIGFAAEESGMTACFCARYENQKGFHGVWGPVVQAVIP